ncbi:uncharacterized protein FOMMEDRAFT_126370 [Fomitiporia mediterranea MF3/22]|uniref:uncharacterized protein n=1 Tax=Fomitiporia mediterranea (strain MF3/22) TaxID=694068 RepID=UPI00044077E4|nr:uncharacterized protein FOMMEDRAFT_126370 [Fomitiporia mediterranea MF3/22]EJD01444.1 hypothetical protein FOMMEDRAFT_126370 [Fomitiporia mediterranea MF3/22]
MCGGPQWKREVVPDHKFDFIDTRDFTDHGCWMRTRYLWIYVLVLKSFLVYVFDIFTAITMLTTNTWSNHIFDSCQQNDDNGCVFIPFTVGKWLFVGCIIAGFLLLAYEARKARKIIASRDISYAFTNIMANNYYSLRSYDHFCFFCRINNSTKKKDDFAFFVFFTFKSWKRLLLSDGPRQAINGLTLYSFYLSQKTKPGSVWDLNKYTNGSIITGALIFSTLTTVLIFAGSALLLMAAGVFYIPLLCYIQGNLKEYCCHKVDKRISEIVKRKKKERLAEAAKLAKKEAAGDFSHLKNKKGELVHNPLPQPTLPDIKLDDEFMDDSTSVRTRVTGATDYYYADYKNAYATDYPPPMPPYKQQYGGYASSLQSSDDPSYYYADNKYDSQANLANAAAPVARQTNNSSPMANPHSANYNGTFGYDGQHGGTGYDSYNHDGHTGYGQDVPGAYAVSGDANEYGQQHSQGYSHYGQSYEQDIGQSNGYAYEPQADYHSQQPLTNVPARTASRAQNHGYQQPSRQGYGGGNGYDAYGAGGGYGAR